MTSAALLQRAAELVIEFGLDDADTTAQQVYASAACGDALIVAWSPKCNRIRLPKVSLDVRRRTCWLTARVTVDAECLTAVDMQKVAAFADRVANLAEHIEALR